MIKRVLILFVVAFAAISCSKDDEPQGEYEPWIYEDYIGANSDLELEDSKMPLIITEQNDDVVAIYDQPTGSLLWEWDPAEDPDLNSDQKQKMTLITDAKPILNMKCMLVTATRGGCAVVRIEDKKLLFYVEPGGMPHSAEILPDNTIVVASSTGHTLKRYDYATRALIETVALPSGHNAVWDSALKSLWCASGYSGKPDMSLIQFKINSSNKLYEVARYAIPNNDGDSEPHECIPDYYRRVLHITTNGHVYEFDIDKKEFTLGKCYRQNIVKSVSTGPTGFNTILTTPTSSYYTTRVTDYTTGEQLFTMAGAKIYKARWFVNNSFSYGGDVVTGPATVTTETLSWGDTKADYRVKQYGDKMWMVENLRWAGESGNLGVELSSARGYSWYEAMTGIAECSAATAADKLDGVNLSDNSVQVQGACPDGWHVANPNDWYDLVVYIKQNYDVPSKSSSYFDYAVGGTAEGGYDIYCSRSDFDINQGFQLNMWGCVSAYFRQDGDWPTGNQNAGGMFYPMYTDQASLVEFNIPLVGYVAADGTLTDSSKYTNTWLPRAGASSTTATRITVGTTNNNLSVYNKEDAMKREVVRCVRNY